MIAPLWSLIGGYGIAALAGLVAVLCIMAAWRRVIALQEKNRGLRQYKEKRNAMDEVTSDDDLSRVRDRLRERGQRGRDL